MKEKCFNLAKPVFIKNNKREMNQFYGFKTVIESSLNSVLRITGVNHYNVYINGNFVFYGPARACHNVYRVDEIDISKFLTENKNVVCINLSTYNIDNFEYLNEEGFIQFEIISDNKTVAYSSTDNNADFLCYDLTFKEKLIDRYAFQRTFCEAYYLDGFYNDYYYSVTPLNNNVDVSLLNGKFTVERDLYYPEFNKYYSNKIICQGSCKKAYKKIDDYLLCYNTKRETYDCYNVNELKTFLLQDVFNVKTVTSDYSASTFNGFYHLNSNGFVDLDFDNERTGLIGLDIIADDDTELLITFDELYENDTVSPIRLVGTTSAIKLNIKKGVYHFVSHEIYSLRYIRIINFGKNASIGNVGIYHCGFYLPTVKYNGNDKDELLIFNSALETFRQNTFDIYMDCPSRERAGWLCDSYFTAKAEYSLTGKSQVEHAFLENFIYEKSFRYIDDGMLPMCYPADHKDGTFIPNWSMWFILELNEYLLRSNDRKLIDDAKEKVYKLLGYFTGFENNYGLIEKLKGWTFVEWSKSNDFINDVNYPTNMLYAKTLSVASKLYNDGNLLKKADRIISYIRNNTLIGNFFCDNSVYKNGKLELSGEISETCQYYAFFTGVATRETHSDLWNILVNDFKPDNANRLYKNVYSSAPFIGKILRIHLLYDSGLKEQAIKEIKDYYLYMAKTTGTLWEKDATDSSCNHGFSSYLVSLLIDKYK